MFVQATKCTHGRSTYLTYLVRESFRTSKGPRSRTVCNITPLPAATRRLIAQSLRGQSFVAPETLQLTQAWSFGGLAVLHQAWDSFALDGLFGPVAKTRSAGLLKAMVFGRILFPSAKLALVDHARGTLLAAACGLDQGREDFNEDDLYAAMDELTGRWVPMEKQLFGQSFPQGVSLVLYDLSSVYFEGEGPAGISRYGHSSDHRPDRPQVFLAVATDAQGVPLHLEVLRGNRGGTTTLQGLLATLRRRFGIKEAVFVFDGGMSSKVNLQALEDLKLRYVTRLGAGALEELLAQLPPRPGSRIVGSHPSHGNCARRQTLRDRWRSLAAAAGPAATPGALSQGGSRTQTPGCGKTQKGQSAETGQSGGPCLAATQSALIFPVFGRSARQAGVEPPHQLDPG